MLVQVIGVGCPNPPAMATYRCSMYSAPLVVSTDVNYGQLRAPTGSNLTDVFQARIRGSNGMYLLSPSTPFLRRRFVSGRRTRIGPKMYSSTRSSSLSSRLTFPLSPRLQPRE